ncbi:VacJ family lipoprotein [Caldichromatium japonicum]|uniref:VacJ family lipoprotein n=2 Tax=Caldichromatium japonicum TaxID=2699430 RepID=A0A6G7VGY8_9GAMM|nr:VacJ family lipoprotein [Caldichromatium japonicum]QIK39146.1 VacJ family lipoprotein [Caldichromatium japonicum]
MLLVGCTSQPERVPNPRDPLEPFNRVVFRFNRDFDHSLVQPVARAYQRLTPEPVNRGITNFFNNLADVGSAVNNVLQFKMARAGSDVGRIFINSTVGFLGFVDVATNVGLPSYKEDFGQTLGYWGVEPGAYLVLPLLGPSTMRESIGMGADLFLDPVFWIRDDWVRWTSADLKVIDQRADLLKTTRLLETIAWDPYPFVRDVYLQRRQNLVYDGHPPADAEQPDLWKDVQF